MKYLITFLVLLQVATSVVLAAPSNNTAEWYRNLAGVMTWIAPDEAAIPNNAAGQLIKDGKKYLTETYKYLGPESSMPYSNTRLSCTNCHMDEGVGAFGASWAVVGYKYGGNGRYSARSNRYLTMKNRVHDCMLRSMNGRQLPDDSYELAAIIAYMEWLGQGIQAPLTSADWAKVVGQGNISVPDIAGRRANPDNGKIIYEDKCAACHQSDGSGVWDAKETKYVYPALWGTHSFNNGAGMTRLRTAVGFVKGNMPYGWANASDPTRQLSPEDAWDVTAYMINQDRPLFSGYLTDWSGYTPAPSNQSINCMPNWMRKFTDANYEYYYPRVSSGGVLTGDTRDPAKYSADQHRFGPWADMLTEQTTLQKNYLNASTTQVECRTLP